MTTHNTSSQNDIRPLPSTEPQCDKVEMWALQQELLSCAEDLYGRRDESFELCQPIFHKSQKRGPRVNFTHDKSGVFALLTPKAGCHWRFAVYQLAHETVHLLNPVKRGEATFLEEGIAVAFSRHVQSRYDINVVESQGARGDLYRFAYRLVKSLPNGHLDAKRIRLEFGGLSDASFENLRDLFTNLEPEIACILTSKFPVC